MIFFDLILEIFLSFKRFILGCKFQISLWTLKCQRQDYLARIRTVLKFKFIYFCILLLEYQNSFRLKISSLV